MSTEQVFNLLCKYVLSSSNLVTYSKGPSSLVKSGGGLPLPYSAESSSMVSFQIPTLLSSQDLTKLGYGLLPPAILSVTYQLKYLSPLSKNHGYPSQDTSLALQGRSTSIKMQMLRCLMDSSLPLKHFCHFYHLVGFYLWESKNIWSLMSHL